MVRSLSYHTFMTSPFMTKGLWNLKIIKLNDKMQANENHNPFFIIMLTKLIFAFIWRKSSYDSYILTIYILMLIFDMLDEFFLPWSEKFPTGYTFKSLWQFFFFQKFILDKIIPMISFQVMLKGISTLGFSVGICKYKPGYKSHDLL